MKYDNKLTSGVVILNSYIQSGENEFLSLRTFKYIPGSITYKHQTKLDIPLYLLCLVLQAISFPSSGVCLTFATAGTAECLNV